MTPTTKNEVDLKVDNKNAEIYLEPPFLVITNLLLLPSLDTIPAMCQEQELCSVSILLVVIDRLPNAMTRAGTKIKA
jgi:hypothetical protein